MCNMRLEYNNNESCSSCSAQKIIVFKTLVDILLTAMVPYYFKLSEK